MPKTPTTYVALTTLNAEMHGYEVLLVGAPGETRDSVATRARDAILARWGETPGTRYRIETETEIVNLRLTSKSSAQRFFAAAWSRWTDPERLAMAAAEEELALELETRGAL